MRAILINGFDQKIEEINLPTEVAAFQQEVRRLLRTEDWRIVDRKEWLTVIYDESMLSKETLCYTCYSPNPGWREGYYSIIENTFQ